jgi:hypothetical protein
MKRMRIVECGMRNIMVGVVVASDLAVKLGIPHSAFHITGAP